METELREANRLLAIKVDKLMVLLNVCPTCIEGHLRDCKHPLPSSLAARAFAAATNTWSPTIAMYCSNPNCDYETTCDNPDYKGPLVFNHRPIVMTPLTEEAANDQFADLFG